MRLQRNNLSPDFVSSTSKKIAKKVIQSAAFLNAKKMAYYFPFENEVDPIEIVARARELQKSLYLPVLFDHQLHFYLINEKTIFTKNKFGIDEPDVNNQTPVLAEQLDLILIPVVAFDRHGNRLGHGAGFYDRTLQFVKNTSREVRPVLIGLAYAFQKVDALIPDEWDVRLDEVMSE